MFVAHACASELRIYELWYPLPLPAARLIPAGPWHKGLACVSIEDLALRSGGCCHSSCESCSTAYVRVLSSCVIVRFRAVYILY